MRELVQKQNQKDNSISFARSGKDTTAQELNHHQLPAVQTRFNHNFSRIPVHSKASIILQPKLAISSPGDIYEQEADHIAQQVMNMSEPHEKRTGDYGVGNPLSQNKQPNQKHLQAKHIESSGLGQNDVPPIVHEALGSPGQPLDPEVRAFMEPRFGHDFSRVRLHSGGAAQASAAAEGALAYATGHDVVFGAGQYQPHTVAGRWLIAHELAHVIQQQKPGPAKGAEAGALEQQAGDAGMRVALGGNARVSAAQGGPAVQFLRVSSGGFGKALEAYTNSHGFEDKAVILLTKSPTFMKLVTGTLDKHYVWAQDPIFKALDASGKGELQLGPDGHVVKPAFAAGKRAIRMTGGGEGPQFLPYDSLANAGHSDLIVLQGIDTPTFIQHLAHEATHAAAFVGGQAPQPQTLVDEVMAEAGIRDEIHARESEAKILGEIPDPKVKDRVKLVGSREPWQVERDVPPALNLTYLEGFFFERELRNAKSAQKLDDTQAARIRSEIDNSFGSIVLKPSPGYGQIWFEWKTAEHEWKEFNKTHSPEDSTFDAEKEKLIQDHAKRFFKGKESYRPIRGKNLKDI